MELTPYLMFDGACENALKFYAKALNGEIKDLTHFEGSLVENLATEKDKKKVMHSHFVANGIMFMASDTGQGASKLNPNGMVHLCINFDNEPEQEKAFNALAEDGVVGMPLQDTFWGARFGMLTDKFGICWMLNYEKPKPV